MRTGSPTPRADPARRPQPHQLHCSRKPERAGSEAGRRMGPPGKSTHGLGQRVPGGGARDVYSSGQRRWLGGAGDCDGKRQRISRTGHGHRTFQRAVRASTITATGASSGRVGAAVVTISNSSPQLGYGPQRLGFEGNDSVISKHQAVGASYFSQAWAVTAGAAITSQPAVVDGVAYFGDSGGVFHAVTVSDAKSSWTDSIGSGFSSSPAVDGGSVFVGDQAGTVLAVSTATGSSEWSRSLGSSITSSPAVSGGIVFVASSARLYTLQRDDRCDRVVRRTGCRDGGQPQCRLQLMTSSSSVTSQA